MSSIGSKGLLFGLIGPSGCGKSTVAKMLSENKEYKFVEYSMALPLKRSAVDLGFSEKSIFGTQEEKMEKDKFWGISGRKFLQIFGTDICRDYLPKIIPDMKGIWVSLMSKFVSENREKNIVISDVRFPDEAEKIRELGGRIIYIHRSIGGPSLKGEESLHKSEKEISSIQYNHVLINDGAMDDLREGLEKLLRRICITDDLMADPLVI